MLRLAADENFNARILRGLERRLSHLDVLTAQQAGLTSEPDPRVLEWAAQEGRVLLTHDVSTMIGYAWERVREGKPMPGAIAVPSELPIGTAIEDLLLTITTGSPESLEERVLYLPL